MSTKPRWPQGLRDKLFDLFGADLRSLALFRIMLGLSLILDWFVRAYDITAFYTDSGFLPRHALLIHYPQYLSLHLLGGTLLVQWILFAIALLAAVALTVGYRSTLAAIISWLLLIGIQSRNPLLLSNADTVQRMALFWGLLMPLGAVFSVDAALAPKAPRSMRTLSVATLGCLVQVTFIYFCSALLKTGAPWHDGSAIYYTMQLDLFVTPIGKLLAQLPAVMFVMTHAVFYLELCGTFLWIFPWRTGIIRTIGLLLFILFQIGLWIHMEIGWFPLVNIVSLLALLPSWPWELLARRLPLPPPTVIFYDGECGFCRKTVLLLKTFLIIPRTEVIPAQTDDAIYATMSHENSWVVRIGDGQPLTRFDAIIALCEISPIARWIAPLCRRPLCHAFGTALYRWISNHRPLMGHVTRPLTARPISTSLRLPGSLVAGVALAYLLLTNIGTLPGNRSFVPEWLRTIALLARLDQKWDMFAPRPLVDDGWFVIPSQLMDGSEFDLVTNGPLSYEKPKLVINQFRSFRWRKYLTRIYEKKYKWARLYYGKYLCRDWNARHQGQQRLKTFKLIFMRERTLPNYAPPTVERIVMWDHICFPKRRSADATKPSDPTAPAAPAQP